MTDATGGEPEPNAVLRLVVVEGNAAGFSVAVEDRLVIGRQSEGPGCLAGDLELSRHHAEISREATGDYIVQDLASTNGTFVNGERLDSPAVLQRGDKIGVGATTLEVLEAPTTIDTHGATAVSRVPGQGDGQPPSEAEDTNAIPQLELHLTIELAIASSSHGEPIRLRLSGGSWQIDDGKS